MLRLVTLLRKVQVMADRVSLVGDQVDSHIELTPSFLLNAEGSFLESYRQDVWSAMAHRSRHEGRVAACAML